MRDYKARTQKRKKEKQVDKRQTLFDKQDEGGKNSQTDSQTVQVVIAYLVVGGRRGVESPVSPFLRKLCGSFSANNRDGQENQKKMEGEHCCCCSKTLEITDLGQNKVRCILSHSSTHLTHFSLPFFPSAHAGMQEYLAH